MIDELVHNYVSTINWVKCSSCNLEEYRSNGPVKVLKRKLVKTPGVSQVKKQLIKRKISPQVLSPPPPYPNSTFDTQQTIPTKPSDAKRCRNCLLFHCHLLKKFSLFLSFISLHNCLLQKRSLSSSDRQQRNLPLLQGLWEARRNQVRNLCQWIWCVNIFTMERYIFDGSIIFRCLLHK